ncbi:MAG: energy-coupling factor ABC transporter ATP-binding protein [Acidobacteria bacterium]|jgi:cobalt/nickel transport system ATP-binding protein|nr:energy-coupling factor ABC transporter ATP-binding protein [Acidobacteriota bacterium]
MNDTAIEIQHLDFAYGSGKPVLSVSGMTVAVGECVGLVGPNGAGKSTLLLHLNGVLRGRGLVRILGLEVRRNNLKEIRRRVGLLFQDPRQQLFLPSIEEDIAFGPLSAGCWPEAEARQRVATIMARLHLEEIGAASPLRLSPGEQKRAALAAVLVMEPELLAFDEPSAGLDPAGRRDFIELVRALPQTKVIATHDMDLAYELCGRILVMDHGAVEADGPRDEILGNDKLLRAHRLERPLSMFMKGMTLRNT